MATTAAPPTTASVPETTTTVLYVVNTVATHGLLPDPLSGSGGWSGSGCSPSGSTLPDGIWYGYARDLTASSISFDLACLRWVDDPDDDAIEEGGWDIQNSNPKLRPVPVHPRARVTCDIWGCPAHPFPYTEWMASAPVFPESGSELRESGIWLYVNDGNVTEIGEAGLAG